ncbi:hypothetical protein [Kineococcus sp. SYSU DK003]|uniref:hypothetical protein n=1 Tax=Kineococcus sp. SYSU DK003 TaxID=3383124 RepID=UPI003D7D65DE
MPTEDAEPQAAAPTQPDPDAPVDTELNLEAPRYETVEKGEDQSDVETRNAES